MNVSGAYRLHGPHALQGPHTSRPAAPASPSQPTHGTDQLEISPAAEAAVQASEAGDIRADLVARVRGEIAEGTYETPARLEAALDRLLDELG
jgi:negative regulator of flagellin synthesis FlgM